MTADQTRWCRAIAQAALEFCAGFGDWVGARLQKEEAE